MADQFTPDLQYGSMQLPDEVGRYHFLQARFLEIRDFDASGLRRVVVEIQSPRGTLTSRNAPLALKERLALVALRLRWWLTGFLLLRNGLAEAVYSSHRELLNRHTHLVAAVEQLQREVEALRLELKEQRAERGR